MATSSITSTVEPWSHQAVLWEKTIPPGTNVFFCALRTGAIPGIFQPGGGLELTITCKRSWPTSPVYAILEASSDSLLQFTLRQVLRQIFVVFGARQFEQM